MFYKKWWRKLFVLETKKGLLVFFRSAHRLVGLWSVPLALLFSITGIWYFLERANVAGVSDIANQDSPIIEVEEVLINSYDIDYDCAILLAKEKIPGLEIGDIFPAENTREPIYITGKSDVALVRNRANRVYIDPNSYKVVSVLRAENNNTVTWLNNIADPLHFGNFGGLFTKIIWFVMGLGISSLVLSGIWITLKRNVEKRKKAKKKPMGVWKYINLGICLSMTVLMYVKLISRYHASFKVLLIISVVWLLFVAVAYYVFVYRLHKK